MKEKKNDGVNDWTVMIYLAGNNNLSEECVWSIKEMFRVGLTDSVSIIVQYGSRTGKILRYNIGDSPEIEVVSDIPNKGSGRQGTAGSQGAQDARAVRRIFWRYESDGGLSEYANVVPNTNGMASAENLRDFIIDCAKKHKANYYMLVLSGHAAGPVGDALFEQNPPSYLSLPRLRRALEDATEHMIGQKLFRAESGNRIDIVGMDACSMSTAEVGYELKDLGSYLVGAQGFERNTGWPYHRVLESLNRDSSILPESLAERIVEDYVRYYSDYDVAGVSVDLAACNLQEFKDLGDLVTLLANLLIQKMSDPHMQGQVLLAHWKAQSYRYEDYTDLWDFCNLLQEDCQDPDIKEACKRVMNAIKDNCVMLSCYSGGAFQHSHGLSIYFPWVEDKEIFERYGKLCFAGKTSWAAFLQNYVCQTRRSPREDENTDQNSKEPYEPVYELEFVVRDGPPSSKGEIARVPRMKNSPVYFYKNHNCRGKALPKKKA